MSRMRQPHISAGCGAIACGGSRCIPARRVSIRDPAVCVAIYRPLAEAGPRYTEECDSVGEFRRYSVRRMAIESDTRGQRPFMITEDVRMTGGVEERQIALPQARVGGPRDEASGQPLAMTGTIVGAAGVAVGAGWQRQANRQLHLHSDRREPSGHRSASRVGVLPQQHLRRTEPASRGDAANRRRRSEAARPGRSPARSPHQRTPDRPRGSNRISSGCCLRGSQEVGMTGSTAKQRVLEAMERLPADATVEDAIEQLVLLAKIERGLAELDAGQGVEHSEAKRRLLSPARRRGATASAADGPAR